MRKIFVIILILIILGIGIAVGYFWGFKNEQAVLDRKLNVIHPLRENNSGYSFIDPLLAYIIPSSDQEAVMATLKNKINNFIDNDKENNNLSNAAVFFYDLNRGRWIGVNETEKYSPASMMKIVIMVAYFKESETNSNILNNYLIYPKDIDDLVKQNPAEKPSDLKIGAGYRVLDLVNKMIIDSDNGAMTLLLNNINQNSLDSIYNALNIENPNGRNDFTISPRSFSLFLRILYSATYLSEADSEKALNILSKTTFADGLVAGVPEGTEIWRAC